MAVGIRRPDQLFGAPSASKRKDSRRSYDDYIEFNSTTPEGANHAVTDLSRSREDFSGEPATPSPDSIPALTWGDESGTRATVLVDFVWDDSQRSQFWDDDHSYLVPPYAPRAFGQLQYQGFFEHGTVPSGLGPPSLSSPSDPNTPPPASGSVDVDLHTVPCSGIADSPLTPSKASYWRAPDSAVATGSDGTIYRPIITCAVVPGGAYDYVRHSPFDANQQNSPDNQTLHLYLHIVANHVRSSAGKTIDSQVRWIRSAWFSDVDGRGDPIGDYPYSGPYLGRGTLSIHLDPRPDGGVTVDVLQDGVEIMHSLLDASGEGQFGGGVGVFEGDQFNVVRDSHQPGCGADVEPRPAGCPSSEVLEFPVPEDTTSGAWRLIWGDGASYESLSGPRSSAPLYPSKSDATKKCLRHTYALEGAYLLKLLRYDPTTGDVTSDDSHIVSVRSPLIIHPARSPVATARKVPPLPHQPPVRPSVPPSSVPVPHGRPEPATGLPLIPGVVPTPKVSLPPLLHGLLLRH